MIVVIAGIAAAQLPRLYQPVAKATPAASPSPGMVAGAHTAATPSPTPPPLKASTKPAAPRRKAVAGVDLTDPAKKNIAAQLVSSAENSSLDWRAQYKYIEDIGDGRGYTGGIIGFCSGTGDMLELVQYYTRLSPANALAPYLGALDAIQRSGGGDSHAGLDPGFTAAWVAAARDPRFQQAQDYERDRLYLLPAVALAKQDGLQALGQFMYFDAAVMHGADGMRAVRNRAAAVAHTPARGGSEAAYLSAFLDARRAEMLKEAAHTDLSRVDTMQRLFLQQGNFDLHLPLSWKTYGDSYTISK